MKSTGKFALILMFGILALLSSTTLAQDLTNAVPAAPSLQESMSLQDIITMGGWLMYVLAAMSVVGLALILYFIFVIRADVVAPRKVVAEAKRLIREGRFEEARQVCEDKASPISAVILAALDYRKGTEQVEAGLLKEIIEGEGTRQASMIQNQTQYLMDIGVIAPMIGLLGTVMGMLKAFNSVALDLAKAKPMLLAAGVSQALITTVAGLLVAIPAMIAYAYFRGKTSKVLARLETAAADILTLLVQKRSS